MLSSKSFGPLCGLMRAHVDELAFGHPAAANILVNENVTLFSKRGDGPRLSLY